MLICSWGLDGASHTCGLWLGELQRIVCSVRGSVEAERVSSVRYMSAVCVCVWLCWRLQPPAAAAGCSTHRWVLTPQGWLHTYAELLLLLAL